MIKINRTYNPKFVLVFSYLFEPIPLVLIDYYYC